MGVLTSEVSYTPAMPRREDHEVHKDMWWGHWTKEKIILYPRQGLPKCLDPTDFLKILFVKFSFPHTSCTLLESPPALYEDIRGVRREVWGIPSQRV